LLIVPSSLPEHLTRSEPLDQCRAGSALQVYIAVTEATLINQIHRVIWARER